MGLFPPSVGVGKEVARGYKGKGSLLHLLVDFNGRPLAVTSTPANGNEREEVTKLLDVAGVEKHVDRLCRRPMMILEADKGYDSNPLRQTLLNRGILPYILRRKSKKPNPDKPPHKETAEAFKIKSVRWRVERAFSWIKSKSRRIRIRWDRSPGAWLAFANLSIIYYWKEILFG